MKLNMKAVVGFLVVALSGPLYSIKNAPLPEKVETGYISVFNDKTQQMEIIEVSFKRFDGNAIHQGDILLGKADKIARTYQEAVYLSSQKDASGNVSNSRWPSGVVPFVIESGAFSTFEQDRIYAAMSTLERTARITFVQRTSHRNYIYITDNEDGCFSNVGRKGGRQNLNLDTGCTGLSTIKHELMHALGMWHEQSRTDRDRYIRIHFDNIERDKRDNFDKRSGTIIKDTSTPYDFNSIMHYHRYAFAIDNSQPTITRLDSTGNETTLPTGGDVLTRIDKQTLRYMYGAPIVEPYVSWARYEYGACRYYTREGFINRESQGANTIYELERNISGLWYQRYRGSANAMRYSTTDSAKRHSMRVRAIQMDGQVLGIISQSMCQNVPMVAVQHRYKTKVS
ncbi:M12 family metallopeptidase [Pleionea sediminis]|uniref:M12 family metallopeptidase n=1 Tax=Pleionea sediminis TaxID=2569479 RepID=UPI0011854115|nr:M12 family metallopeptidase [Pleionea sediminis]